MARSKLSLFAPWKGEGWEFIGQITRLPPQSSRQDKKRSNFQEEPARNKRCDLGLLYSSVCWSSFVRCWEKRNSEREIWIDWIWKFKAWGKLIYIIFLASDRDAPNFHLINSQIEKNKKLHITTQMLLYLNKVFISSLCGRFPANRKRICMTWRLPCVTSLLMPSNFNRYSSKYEIDPNHCFRVMHYDVRLGNLSGLGIILAQKTKKQASLLKS